VQSATRDATVRLPPASYCFYTPNLLEVVFSEARIQDREWSLLEGSESASSRHHESVEADHNILRCRIVM
jgi:hypothetical protein